MRLLKIGEKKLQLKMLLIEIIWKFNAAMAQDSKTVLGICGALHDLVAFLHFKKREKHPWRSVNFSRDAGFSTA